VTLGRWSFDARAAGGIAVGAVVFLALTAQQGFVRDEGYYFRAAREYHAWFEELGRAVLDGQPARAFSDTTLRRFFGYNTEHPGFAKLLMGWTWRIFHDWLGLVSNATGYRLASMMLVGLGLAFTYLFGARLWGRRHGALAVALLLVCPHFFYHSHLACFDGPITALGVVVTYCFWRSLRERRFVLWTGVAFGVALATKHNAVFLPPTLVLAYAAARAPSWSRESFKVPWALVSMAVLGPVLLYVFYPFGWHAPLARLGAYYGYMLRHENYPVDYFGTLYREPPFPWSYPYVMSAITIPLTVLLPGIAGYVAIAARRLRGSVTRTLPDETSDGEWLLLVSTLVPPLIISIPSVPIFGGTKHWMPMMPFFALAAAWAVWRAHDELGSLLRGRARLLSGLAVACAVLLAALETARTHPLGHTYFNELVLGHQGAAALGMPRGFWGGAGRALLDELNTKAPPNARVYTHRMNADSFRMYQADGLIRADLRQTLRLDDAAFALFYCQREHQDVEYRIWMLRDDARPLKTVAFDGVPIVELYDLTWHRSRT
jgi:hypothetical protein